MYLVGVDPGQRQDPTALAILQVHATTPPVYDVVELRRWALLTSYAMIVRDIAQLLNTPPLLRQATLVLDVTGCGSPVANMYEELRASPLVKIFLHGGQRVSQEGNSYYKTPLRDVIAAAQILLQQRRLRIAAALPDAATLTHELLNFRVRIDPRTAHDSYAAWREKDHDDLVFAVAMACWWDGYRQRKVAGVWGEGLFPLP